MKKKIFVADDEKNIRELLKTFLEDEGYKVFLFENGDDLLSEMKVTNPDLVILDITMPGTDGLSVCSIIRKKNDVPIILLTARGSDADYITGFTLGCDDYFTKPFSPVKLVMRVKAMMKRLSPQKNEVKDELEFGDITIYPKLKTSYCKDSVLKLTNTEFMLMCHMFKNTDRAVSREELLNVIWGYESDVETRVTDDTIKRLRKKLNSCNSNVEVETIWGYGFKLNIKNENED
ncbi:response regulator transcription factor [Peptostreptococcus equinus]|uniref:Stage 0 sporulation protein A homolog n=1 Tax=Peptostreptococcus equinus TaxID=3003601 RepID=A0ABY7JQM0_9FIRM|nr:response regulator transcription factor [Peptostreptococcus sp. CBA3647]WAW14468.1 response regulator transcription factor [Peptostreptococcus sp. CBA3647]